MTKSMNDRIEEAASLSLTDEYRLGYIRGAHFGAKLMRDEILGLLRSEHPCLFSCCQRCSESMADWLEKQFSENV